jgi:hypothetical protein
MGAFNHPNSFNSAGKRVEEEEDEDAIPFDFPTAAAPNAGSLFVFILNLVYTNRSHKHIHRGVDVASHFFVFNPSFSVAFWLIFALRTDRDGFE